MITAADDTNIYLSALLFGGPCETILDLARAGLIELYHSPAIARELRRILHTKFHWPESHTLEALQELRTLSQRILPTPRFSGVVTDDTDHRILECAVAARAEYLITGDKRHLQPLKEFHGVRIVSPRTFLNLFR